MTKCYRSLKASVKGQISGVQSDSSKIKPGMIFVAMEGQHNDGHAFIADAVARGAVLVVGKNGFQMPSELNHIAFCGVENPREALADLAADFYGDPSKDMLVLGVTGTSGKTTTSFLLESILKAAGHRVGLIGTVVTRIGAVAEPSVLTTPGAVEVQALLAKMKAAGCTAVVMEVSSHALDQKRVACLAFDGVLFTNLTSEHLDYHQTMESYFAAKAQLFGSCLEYSKKVGKSPVAVVNTLDSWGQQLISSATAPTRSVIVAQQVESTANGLRLLIQGEWVESLLVGAFNIKNILGAWTLAQALGIAPKDIQTGIQSLKGVPGRLEKVLLPESFSYLHVWVDYAHKPDALEKVLQSLRTIQGNHSIITVFGCGGDRDRTKRPMMGRIACELSDFVWITSDNPRTEQPDAIIAEIVQGTQTNNYKVQADRKLAIAEALSFAQQQYETSGQGCFVLVAGKGHEDYQIIGTTKIHMDDRQTVTEYFKPAFGNQK
jgi:UDP-N-acetylmuramoyl-L-alanyl-D-glutamate--2,6-diaminopimelate ligase